MQSQRVYETETAYETETESAYETETETTYETETEHADVRRFTRQNSSIIS